MSTLILRPAVNKLTLLGRAGVKGIQGTGFTGYDTINDAQAGIDSDVTFIFFPDGTFYLTNETPATPSDLSDSFTSADHNGTTILVFEDQLNSGTFLLYRLQGT